MKRSLNKWLKYIFFVVLLFFIISIAINSITTVKKMIYPLKYSEHVFRYSSDNNISPYLIFAVIKAESGFDSNATSRKNAKGLMQIMDATAEEVAGKLKISGFTCDDLYDPEINIRIGCWHVGRLMKEFDRDEDLVIAAYNGGGGNVKQWLKNRELSSSGETLQKIPFKETEKFLKKVKSYYFEYKKLYENSKK